MHRFASKLSGAVAAVACVAALASCSSSDNNSGTVKDYFSAVSAVVGTGPVAQASVGSITIVKAPKTGGNRPSFSSAAITVNATFHSGNAPTGSSGPTANGEAGSTPLLGQPFRYSISGSAAFTSVFVWVDGASGYWQLDLPASTTLVDLILALAANPPQNAFTIMSAVGSSSSAGPAESTALTATDLSSADVAVTVKWTGASDVDLHVFDGKGQEVYYANPVTAEGGRLDLDSNAGCAIDNINQETISWPQGTAPTGTYTVKVDLYDDCGQPTAPFTGTMAVTGHSSRTFSGTFTGVAGTNNPIKTVGTFTFPGGVFTIP